MSSPYSLQKQTWRKSIIAAFCYSIDLHKRVKEDLRQNLPKLYSADLVDILFSYPIITPTALADKLGIHRRTAARYLEELRKNGFLTDETFGRFHLYVNKSLMEVFVGG